MVPMMRKNQSWLPDIFNDFFDTEWMEKTNATAPAINVVEHDNGYAVEVAAPGMTKEDFNVHLDEENNLVISMEKKIENKDENKKVITCVGNFLTANSNKQWFCPTTWTKKKYRRLSKTVF